MVFSVSRSFQRQLRLPRLEVGAELPERSAFSWFACSAFFQRSNSYKCTFSDLIARSVATI